MGTSDREGQIQTFRGTNQHESFIEQELKNRIGN